jgi:hypothetical protein
MNMDEKSVMKSSTGLAVKRLATKDHFMIKSSPPLSSTKKTKTFRAINAMHTSGAVLLELLSSPIGIMSSFYLHGRGYDI